MGWIGRIFGVVTGGWYKWAIIGGIGLVLGLGIYVQTLRLHSAQAMNATLTLQRDTEKQHVIDAQVAIDRLQKQAFQMAQIRSMEQETALKRNQIVSVIKEGIKHEPNANVVAGPGFDALGDKLRQLQTVP